MQKGMLFPCNGMFFPLDVHHGGGLPASSENVAPSMAALYKSPGRILPGLSPDSTPEEWGQLGVRSPVM